MSDSDLDPCSPSPCGLYGSCSREPANPLRYVCACATCWNGRRCNIQTVSKSCATGVKRISDGPEGVTVPLWLVTLFVCVCGLAALGALASVVCWRSSLRKNRAGGRTPAAGSVRRTGSTEDEFEFADLRGGALQRHRRESAASTASASDTGSLALGASATGSDAGGREDIERNRQWAERQRGSEGIQEQEQEQEGGSSAGSGSQSSAMAPSWASEGKPTAAARAPLVMYRSPVAAGAARPRPKLAP